MIALAVLVGAGLVLRILACFAWWPVVPTLADSVLYAEAAWESPLVDPQHPAGYPLLLDLMGVFTHQVFAVVALQHLLGIATALLLFAAVRRISGSPWPALVPAAVILLGGYETFLESTVMSEPYFLAMLAASLYAAVRAIDQPKPWWGWPLAAGGLAAAAAVIRSAAVFYLPVLVLVLLLARPGPWRSRWRAPVAAGAMGAVLMTGYATANLISNGRFEVGPTQGWHLYGRVATFADCRRFEPPAGTERLCVAHPGRRNNDYYMFDPHSPAIRAYGPEPWRQDGKLRAFALAAILHQPIDYMWTMGRDLKSYYTVDGLEPSMDWTNSGVGAEAIVRANHAGMETYFFDHFRVHKRPGLIGALHDYQMVFHDRALLLLPATVLVLIGLFVGSRRSRIGVMLFGGGGLALLVAPIVSVFFVERYVVPPLPLICAGAAIAAASLGRKARQGIASRAGG